MSNDGCWYHGKISRESAHHILTEGGGGRHEGIFLVRESVRTPGNYVLSLYATKQDLHFQIKNHGDAHFSIDDGPVYQGLDALINHYRTQADGLPCKLTSFCRGGTLPPPAARKRCDTELHKAVSEGNLSKVRRLLSSTTNDINTKNEAGLTPVFDACQRGLEDIAKILIQQGADCKTRDNQQNTPLKMAAFHGFQNIVKLLCTTGGCDVQDRSPSTGWVPLHEAALCGHMEVCRMLIQLGAPLNPRTPDGDTPRDLALRYGNQKIVDLLDQTAQKMPRPKTKRTMWLHRSLNRQGAVRLLRHNGLTDGLFMIRPSSRTVGFYALSMVCRSDFFHYEIRSVTDRWFYIDDGPYFESLEYLVEHYMKRSDGLVFTLRTPVKPGEGDAAGRPAMHSLTPKADTDEDYNLFEEWEDDGRRPALPGKGSKAMAGRLPAAKPPVPGQSGQQTQAAGGMMMIDRNQLKLGRQLGEGEFGSVLKGRYTTGDRREIDVAIKTLRTEQMAHGEREFLREARVMMGLDHPCIVCLIGVCLAKPMMLVQELVALGSLLDYLLMHVNKIDVATMELWASQIANGMLYLEQRKFVHRDLAARNILLASLTQCKISDFGLSRAVGTNSDYYRASQGGRWPVKWYAPESINYGTFSHASDVWSYGVTLWEMYSFGDQPYDDMSGAEVLHMLENRGQRLAKPLQCPDHTYRLMKRCWSLEPHERPSFEQLYQIFLQNPEYENIRSQEGFYADPRELVKRQERR